MFAVCMIRHDDDGPTRLTDAYLGDDGPYVNLPSARTFDNKEDADIAAMWLDSEEDPQPPEEHTEWVAVELNSNDIDVILRHRLKQRARELFNLPYNTPALVLADRYGDAGMEEEAMILRGVVITDRLIWRAKKNGTWKESPKPTARQRHLSKVPNKRVPRQEEEE